MLASYLWLRMWRSAIAPERYAAMLGERHRRNSRRIHRAILAAGGLFIKVGQLISILSNFLPAEFRKELQGLQDRLPPRPFGEIVARLTAEFGRGPDELFDTFDRSPIATASLAQVHAATLGDGRRLAVKAQHADIERIARGDLEIIRRLLKLIQFFTGVRGIESYHPEISQMIAEELDFTKEASNIERVTRNFAGDTTVRLPIVVPERSSRRVLTTEFIDGTKITDFDGLAARGLDRRQLAERIVTAYCRMIFVDGVYHADPHPGNIFVAEDGAIVFVDFGAVGVLAPHMREGIPAFFQGVIGRDPQRITDAIRTMGFVARDPRSGDVAARVIAYFQSRFLDQLSDESFSLGSLQVDMRVEARDDRRPPQSRRHVQPTDVDVSGAEGLGVARAYTAVVAWTVHGARSVMESDDGHSPVPGGGRARRQSRLGHAAAIDRQGLGALGDHHSRRLAARPRARGSR